MANLPQQDTIIQSIGDGITINYTVPFYTPLEIDGTPDLDVYTQAPTATPIPTTDINIWNTAYTYTPNLDPTTGGFITFLPGYIPPLGWIVTIVRDIQASLNTEFSDATTFSGITLDNALDRLLLISQQNKSYALGRNLSYIVNSYLPESTLLSNVQIPVLQNGQVWLGSLNGVIAATLNQSGDTSTLRSELSNNSPVTNGAALVGYYDTVNLNPTTVAAQLSYLTDSVVAPFPTGCIIDFGGTTPPAGFLVCNGQTCLITTYPNLFAAIGNTWGGDGITNFLVPNLNGKTTAGTGGTLFSGSDTVGLSGGAPSVTLNNNNLPAHTHPASTTITTPGTGVTIASGTATAIVFGNSGSAVPFSNIPNVSPVVTVTVKNNDTEGNSFGIIQPTAIVLKIIKT